ncbi:RNA dependent RNA polymerase-domain-containing protein [Mycena leptocephala]|nr:RNA dependent RNA polymerase-domain-containing protein [Mycena leptocephala]
MAALSRQLFGLELDDDDEAEDLLADDLRMYTASTSLSAFLQSDLPPLFERLEETNPLFAFDDQQPIAERTSSFSDEDFRVTSRASQGLRLVFRSRQDLDTFLARCRTLRLPNPLDRDITVIERSIYAEAKLVAMQASLRSLRDFGLAFEVEKAVWGGILEPEEVVSMRDSLVELQQKTDKSETAAIFRYFLTTLRVPGLESTAPRKADAGPKNNEPPSAFQFRCGGAKGVLVQNPDLMGKTLYFRPSQTKFEAADLRTLDIAATSSRPILAYLNRPLIALLEYHGTPPDAFMALQKLAIDEGQSIKNSLLQASKISLSTAWAVLPPAVPLQHLYYLLNSRLGSIRPRGSYTLIGVSDEWDCLEEGEVYATVVDDRTGLNMPITGRILITRSPQIHPGDVQFVRAVRRPQLEHLKNVIVFACKGSRSLPSQLGGGDLDGDIYNLILDENLFPPKEFTAVPGDTSPSPRRHHIPAASQMWLISLSIILNRFNLNEEEGPGWNCVKLTEHASHAVDFCKRGVPVDFRNLPKPPSPLKPDFLSGEGVNPASSMGDTYYPSAKVLGKLYRSVPIEDYYPELDQQRTDGEKIRAALALVGLRSLGLPSLDSPPEDLLEEMWNILDEYSDQLMVIAKTHTISKRVNAYLSEAELVSGTIQERYDHRKRREAVSAMNLQTGELAKAIRHEFQSPDYREMQDRVIDEEEEDDEFEEEDFAGDEERRRDKFERAWAAWIVAEEALDDDLGSYGPSSFGLLALGTMLEVVKEARNRT